MEYNDLIRQWFSRAEDEKDYFTKFIFLYISFTAFVTNYYTGGRKLDDRDIIQEVKNDITVRDLYLRLLRENTALAETLRAAIQELLREPIQDTTRSSNNKTWDGQIRDEMDWRNIIEFWYRVRNNLFHGHKAPEFGRDQLLVKFVFDLMYPLMKHFIDHNLTWVR